MPRWMDRLQYNENREPHPTANHLSWFMRMVAEPLARAANAEEQTSGRFCNHSFWSESGPKGDIQQSGEKVSAKQIRAQSCNNR